MFLITTADERTWKKGEKCVFLGEWCKLFKRKEIWSKMDYVVMPYDDNNHVIFREYQYLTNVYEQYLKELHKKLNILHGTNNSLRYWRILIGPWLGMFMWRIYYRFKSLKSVIESENVTSTWIMKSNILNWVPDDIAQFRGHHSTDQWNHLIYSEIIKELKQIPYDLIDELNLPYDQYKNEIRETKTKKVFKSLAIAYADLVPDCLNKIVFADFIGRKDLIKLQVSLGQMPYPYFPWIDTPKMAVDLDCRNTLRSFMGNNTFEKILDKFIPCHMPKAYLESYSKLKDMVLKKYPKTPKIICTSGAQFDNEGFKIWAAENVDRGAELRIAQHGGNYGTGLWLVEEDHEVKISDRFYSWGWNDNKHSNIKRMPAVKLAYAKRKMRSDNNGRILLVLTTAQHRYTYAMHSIFPEASQFLDYINDQIHFINSISVSASNYLTVRGHPRDYGWDLESRLREAGLGRFIENQQKSETFIEKLNKCRMAIITTNTTTFLETFTANFPTLLFWNPKHWEVRAEAEPYYEELRKAGILHHSPESAAQMLNDIFEDPKGWWEQSEIQNAKNVFCDQFAYTSDNWVRDWKIELRS